MTNSFTPFDETNIRAAVVSFPDRKITWAGEGITPGTFLLGADDGVILEFGIDGSHEHIKPFPATRDGESVNGVAFFSNDNNLHLGVTTRSEIALHRFTANPQALRVARIGFGSHGIKPVADTYFVCPAGASGLLLLLQNLGGDYKPDGLPATEEVPVYYDVAYMGLFGEHHVPLVVAACRTGGLVFADVLPTMRLFPIKVSRIDSRRADFVGVLPIGTEDSPRALVALTKERSLHFFRDPFNSPIIDSLQLFVPGTAYRFIRHGIHLILLTSKGLCVVPNILKEFHVGDYIGGYRKVRFIEIEAIDISVAFEKWLLIVTPDGVVRMELAGLLPVASENVIPEIIKQRMSADFQSLWIPAEDQQEIEPRMWEEASLKSQLMTVGG